MIDGQLDLRLLFVAHQAAVIVAGFQRGPLSASERAGRSNLERAAAVPPGDHVIMSDCPSPPALFSPLLLVMLATVVIPAPVCFPCRTRIPCPDRPAVC